MKVEGMVGMQSLNRINYAALVERVHTLFCDTFGTDISFKEKTEAFEHMGYFCMKYSYLPLGYILSFENDRNTFDIEIYDEEEAKNSLYRIIKYNNELEIKNIEHAIRLLQRILEKGDFCFYLTRGNKIYRKKNQQYERIEDLVGLMKDIENRREKQRAVNEESL